MKTGYFQYLWLLIWNNLIKNSGIYRLLRKIYDFFSSKWQTAKITSWFRRADVDTEEKSRFKRLFGTGFRIMDKLQRKNEFFTKCKENSLIVRMCKYMLHNFLAVNLRFIGVLGATGFGVYTVLKLITTGFSAAGLILTLICGFIGIFNVNIADFAKSSKILALAEYFLDTKLSYKFYYMTKCEKSVARYYSAVFFGVAAGAVGAFVNPIIGLGLILGVLFVSMVMYKTEFGVFMAVMLAPFLPTMALAAMVLLCAFSLAVKALTEKNFKWRFGIVGMFIILMIAIYLIAGIFSFARMKSLQIWAIYAVMMGFFFVVINTIRTKKQLFDLCRLFVISGLLVCVYGFYQFLFIKGGSEAWIDEEMFGGITTRLYATLENPNVMGEYILLVMPICIALMWKAEKLWSKLFYLVIAGIMGVALILTFSRGCWIALVVAAAVYVTFVCGKLWGLLLLAIPVLPFVIPETVLQRLTSIGDMSDSSTSYRVYIWMGTLLMMKDFWISGIGMGEEAFNAVYPFYSYSAVVAPHSHNLFLQIWVETGIGGIFNFLLLLIFWFRKICHGHKVTEDKKLKTLLVAIGAAVIAFMVQGMFDNCFYNYRVFMLFWFVLALGAAAANIAKEDKE